MTDMASSSFFLFFLFLFFFFLKKRHRPDDQTLIKSFGGLKKFAKAHADRFQWIDGDIPSNTKLRAKKHGSNGGGGGSRAPKQTHNPMVKVNHYSSHTSSSSANAESSPSVSPAATDYVDRDRPVEVYLTCGENQAHLFWKNPKNEAWLREVLEPSGKVLKLFLNDESTCHACNVVRCGAACTWCRASSVWYYVRCRRRISSSFFTLSPSPAMPPPSCGSAQLRCPSSSSSSSFLGGLAVLFW